ncbi:MAG: hypothetical protein IAC32_02735 [Bacteroidetes bacterium]|uniref:Uncharacterized protein n=1 Tax=Candidatus Enterocola intestinipullorum TaxID=2840783 RepID=A0A9D9EHT4_9BACT|nr:hypothetical protein [Candidatus Enterocola intestinipullorum]
MRRIAVVNDLLIVAHRIVCKRFKDARPRRGSSKGLSDFAAGDKTLAWAL